MPIVLIMLIAGIMLGNEYIPIELQSFVYSLSLSIKSFIICILPFLIFSLLFKVAAHLVRQASKWILFIFLALIVSNFLSTWISHFVGLLVFKFDLSVPLPVVQNALEASWSFNFPQLISNDKAMFSGIILGAFLGLVRPNLSSQASKVFEVFVNKTLSLIVYLIPVFVAGFVIKLQSDGVMVTIVRDYALIFVIILMAQFSYILFLYLLANGFRSASFLSCVKNMIPAGIGAFSTMSSAASMPLTLIGTEKNAKDKDLARSIIPITVNVHLIGDCFAIPILAFAIMKSYGLAEPSLFTYLIFSIYFVIAKFSVAGIPGGGIIVMLPILEKHLGFSSEMMSLITALYILFDPVITCANVMGNGGFALLIDRLKSR
jgi:Na+/H+-dicarboxylate symporter